MTRRVLFVGSAHPGDEVRRRLERGGLAVSALSQRERAFEQLLESPVDLVVVNLDEAENSADFIQRIRTTSKLNDTLVLAVGEWGTGQPAIALSLGADAYEPTPIDAARVADSVERLLNKRAAVAGMNE